MYKLSIVILSYNTKKLLEDCLKSLQLLKKEVDFKIVVVDNASVDGSDKMVEDRFPNVKLIKNPANFGFAKGNNQAKKFTIGSYVLFLNSDTLVPSETLRKSIEYLDENKEVGALTCKIVLPSGKPDKDARRSFITPWIGLTHVVLKLDKIFPESKYFARYWYGYVSAETEHEVDALQGAYLLTRKSILDEIGWFDEDYFLDGEDIDLCWRIKEKGWKIIYYPAVSITHLKGASKGKIDSEMRKNIPLSERLKFRMAGVDSMEKFVRKRLWNKYPIYINFLVLTGIRLVKFSRFIRTIILG